MRGFALLGVLLVAFAVAANALLRPADRPEARFPTLAGKSLALSDLRGRVVLVDFWATYCEPCIKEMPRLEKSYRRFAPRGYDVVAIALPADNPNRVADFARRAELPFTVGLDLDGAATRAFGDVQVTPTSFLIGKDGRILRKYVGEPDWADLDAAVERALAS